MDKIKLKELQLFGRHGVLPEENRLGQMFRVSLCLELDLKAAGENDEIEHSIDYREVLQVAADVVGGPPVKLLETLAERIAGRILAAFPRVASVTAEVGKPSPPLPVPSSGTYVEIRRNRRD